MKEVLAIGSRVQYWLNFAWK